MILPEHKEPEQHPNQDHNQEEGGQEQLDHVRASPQGTRIFVGRQYMRENITHRAQVSKRKFAKKSIEYQRSWVRRGPPTTLFSDCLYTTVNSRSLLGFYLYTWSTWAYTLLYPIPKCRGQYMGTSRPLRTNERPCVDTNRRWGIDEAPGLGLPV